MKNEYKGYILLTGEKVLNLKKSTLNPVPPNGDIFKNYTVTQHTHTHPGTVLQSMICYPWSMWLTYWSKNIKWKIPEIIYKF